MTSQDDRQRPDYWIVETTTPGLLIQTDLNQPGENETLFSQANMQPLQDETVVEHSGLLLEMAAQHGRNCADFDELLKPLAEVRTTRSASESHAYFFGPGSCETKEQARRLRILARELEQAAAHILRQL